MRTPSSLQIAAVVFACSTYGCAQTRSVVWTQPESQAVALGQDHLATITAVTHNGAITATAITAPATAALTITKRAAAPTIQEAQRALAAIDVFVETDADSGTKIGWRWKGVGHLDWTAEVSYTLQVPTTTAMQLVTHNGKIKVSGAEASVQAQTHNGEIDVSSGAGTMQLATHNGEINVMYGGDSLQATTHNGKIDVDLTKAKTVGGKIVSHNGGIKVQVGNETATQFECSTANGRVTIDTPTSEVTSDRRHAKGRLGAGGAALEVSTHNGSIQLQTKSSGT